MSSVLLKLIFIFQTQKFIHFVYGEDNFCEIGMVLR